MSEAIIFTSDEERSAYRMMLLIRRFEEKAGQLYALGAIAGSSPLSIGQEGLITGLAMSLAEGDRVVASHRTHGIMLALGVSPEAIMAELMGRAAGVAGGRGGSHHMAAPERGYFGGYPAPGQAAGIAAGLALAAKADGKGHVAVAILGDGGAQRGRVHEAYRHAGQMKLPVLFVIDNNAASPDETRALSEVPLADAGRPYNIPGFQVDGIDVRKVRADVKSAVARARRGEGPTILEMMTYRYRGHGGMPARPGQAEKRRDDADPIAKARARMIEMGVASDADLKAVEKAVRDEVNAAANAAKSAPLAALPHEIRGVA